MPRFASAGHQDERTEEYTRRRVVQISVHGGIATVVLGRAQDVQAGDHL